MDKYQRLFITQMKDKIKAATTSGQSSSEAELYRLLHSAKGTAGTIGLDDWFRAASKLLEHVEAESTKVWNAAQARELLAPLAFLLLNIADEPEGEQTAEQSEMTEAAEVELPPYKGTVLVVDDDLSLLLVIKEHLERLGYMVLATSDGERAMELFYNMKPDCVVLDIMLDKQNGLDILQEMQSRSEQYLIPFIVMSTNRNRSTRIRAYELGADDFIGKPFNMNEFAVRVKRQVCRRLQLNRLLMMDELTGAYNSTFLAQELVRQLQLQLERPQPATLTLFDLDSFRYINERFGYTEGDRLLKYFSDLVKQALGPQDIWARDRHDRFYLLQPGIGEKEASSFARQLLERLGQDEQAGLDGYHLSFSAGVLELKPGMTAAVCYDQMMRIVAEAKRSREGVMIVPERRRTVENGQATRLVEMMLDAATYFKQHHTELNETGAAESVAAPAPVSAEFAKPVPPQTQSSRQQEQTATQRQQAAKPATAFAQDEHDYLSLKKMNDLISSLSSRLKRHESARSSWLDHDDDDNVTEPMTTQSSAPVQSEARSQSPSAQVPPAADDSRSAAQVLPAADDSRSAAQVPPAADDSRRATQVPPAAADDSRSAAQVPPVSASNSKHAGTAAPSAPVFRADTIREVTARDGSGRRLEWVDRDEKALLSQQTVEIQQAPVPPVDISVWRLAIIDDDDLIRNMLTKRLSALQAEHELDIRAFSDGEEFFSDPWHGEDAKYLLILDRMMPRMNGMEVLRRLRSSNRRNRYTVLMLTGVGDDREVADAISAGTDDYLTKPFSVVELEARIRRLLGRMKA
ncbi:response regulator [Paenibacillus sp. SGZ-1009]|uniref:response regulator n=1 Tax=Paenibacillus campi TaxID=3106031 RepID=UPI002B003208|nr:response regulator [Paenibacillus sp. SGZ-1009]